MSENSTLKKRLFLKLLEEKPHLSVALANETIDRLFNCEESLFTNVIEWLESKKYSDIWIKDKYCVGAVLKMRGDTDFISAIIALDDYAKDESKEHTLWKTRA